jgi:hypothetical protein
MPGACREDAGKKEKSGDTAMALQLAQHPAQRYAALPAPKMPNRGFSVYELSA